MINSATLTVDDVRRLPYNALLDVVSDILQRLAALEQPSSPSFAPSAGWPIIVIASSGVETSDAGARERV